MSLGTTTRSLPNTKIAPALFAVPEIINQTYINNHIKLSDQIMALVSQSMHIPQ